MLNEKILDITTEFCGTFNIILKGYPQYALDLNYQSLTTINLLLETLRGKTSFSDEENKYLNGCACYLAAMAHDIWAFFPGSQNLDLNLNENNEVILSTYGAKYTSEDSPYIINLTRTLKSILVSDTIMISPEYSKKLNSFENFIAPAFLGIACGFSPYGVGVWTTKKCDDLLEHTAVAVSSLATSTAQTYKKLFPLEKYGAQPELYISGLIYPPTGFEDYEYAKSALSLIKFKNKNTLDDNEFYTLSKNLARLPDPRISETGLICAVSLATADDLDLRLLLDSKLLHFDIFSAVSKIRPQLSSGNFLQVLETGELARAVNILELEKTFNLVPYIKFPSYYCQHQHLADLISALYLRNLKSALEALQELERQNKIDLDLFLQKIFIQICLGDLELAKKELEKIDLQSLPEGSPEQGFLLEFTGIIYYLEQDFKNSYNYLMRALNIPELAKSEKIIIAENISNILMASQQFDELIKFSNKLEINQLQNLNILINHCLAYLHVEDKKEFREILKNLVQKIPFDKRVFALLRMSLSMN
ncbi:MAG: hypothetical protein LBE20_06745 [Deltaproteobacteria bacterium]|jgi:hypothetical protein|nr:hypothetical protein [Deltaproteobacteria bacterium]